MSGGPGDKPIILIFGSDPALLDTRVLLLERTGALVISTTSLPEAKKIATAYSVSLVVICRSVSFEDCQSLLSALDEAKPNLERLLTVANTALPCLGPLNKIHNVFDGPAAFTAAVHAMLQHDSAPILER